MKLPPMIVSKTNARVKALRSAFSGRASQHGELIGIEGVRMLMEAVKSQVQVDMIYIREGAEDLVHILPPEVLNAAPLAILRGDVFDESLDTQHPQPIAATCEIPQPREPVLEQDEGVVLVLDGLQDPGNVGTLIRSAEAFAVRQVFLTPGTANPWSPKVLRASAGSVFRAPLVRAPLAEIKRMAIELDMPLLGAVAQSAGANIVTGSDLRPPCALMIGNEGNGLSAEALRLADALLYIPCLTESLNAAVAGSVLLYEALRQRIVEAAAGVEAGMPTRVM